LEDRTEGESVDWIAAKADIYNFTPGPEDPYKWFGRGCRVLYRQRVRLQSQKSVRSIALSFIKVGEHSYLTGLRLDFGYREDVQIGYRAPNKQITELNSKTLNGIRLAIGPRGIQGFQFVTDGGSNYLKWFGRPDNLPETNRLVSQSENSGESKVINYCL
jgi:hypothetical protein